MYVFKLCFNSVAHVGCSDNEEDLDLLLVDCESDDESSTTSRHTGVDNEEDEDDTVIRVSKNISGKSQRNFVISVILYAHAHVNFLALNTELHGLYGNSLLSVYVIACPIWIQ